MCDWEALQSVVGAQDKTCFSQPERVQKNTPFLLTMWSYVSGAALLGGSRRGEGVFRDLSQGQHPVLQGLTCKQSNCDFIWLCGM